MSPMPATQNCVGSVTTSKQERDGVTRQRQCTRTRSCSGRRRPSARERSSTPVACHMPNVDHRALAKHVQNVFRSLRCFLGKSTCRHIDVGLEKKCSPRLVPKISCVCLLCFTDDGVSWASPSSLLSNTIEFCRPPLSITIAQAHNASQETPTFNSYTLFSKHIFRFASIFKKVYQAAADNFCIFLVSTVALSSFCLCSCIYKSVFCVRRFLHRSP